MICSQFDVEEEMLSSPVRVPPTSRTANDLIDYNVLGRSHRWRGPLGYTSDVTTLPSETEEAFRNSKDKYVSEMLDSNEFIEVLHQPFMIPINQFQLKLRTSSNSISNKPTIIHSHNSLPNRDTNNDENNDVLYIPIKGEKQDTENNDQIVELLLDEIEHSGEVEEEDLDLINKGTTIHVKSNSTQIWLKGSTPNVNFDESILTNQSHDNQNNNLPNNESVNLNTFVNGNSSDISNNYAMLGTVTIVDSNAFDGVEKMINDTHGSINAENIGVNNLLKTERNRLVNKSEIMANNTEGENDSLGVLGYHEGSGLDRREGLNDSLRITFVDEEIKLNETNQVGLVNERTDNSLIDLSPPNSIIDNLTRDNFIIEDEDISQNHTQDSNEVDVISAVTVNQSMQSTNQLNVNTSEVNSSKENTSNVTQAFTISGTLWKIIEHILQNNKVTKHNPPQNVSALTDRGMNNITNNVIGPEYLVQNHSYENITQLKTTEDDDLTINIVPLKSDEIVELGSPDQNENSSDILNITLNNATTYRFVFPSNGNVNIFDQQDFENSGKYDTQWIKKEQGLVNETGLPNECAIYMEKVQLSFLHLII